MVQTGLGHIKNRGIPAVPASKSVLRNRTVRPVRCGPLVPERKPLSINLFSDHMGSLDKVNSRVGTDSFGNWVETDSFGNWVGTDSWGKVNSRVETDKRYDFD